jgi:hypothetical protein
MSIPITGIDQFLGNIAKIDKFAKAFGDEFVTRVREKTPVDTGRLKGSWNLEVNDKTITVTNKAVNDRGQPYAALVEWGTENTRGVFMLNSTIAETADIAKTAKSKVGL